MEAAAAGHNLNLEIKGHWKRETDKNEVAIKVLSSITRKAVRAAGNGVRRREATAVVVTAKAFFSQWPLL